ALSKNGDVRTVDLNEYPMDMSASNLISPEVAKRYKALPIGFSEDNKRLIVAMKSANDIIAIDDLKIMTGYEIEPVIVKENELKVAIDQFDGMSANIENLKPEEDDEPDEEETEKQQSDDQERPAVQLANQIINYAIKAGASDIHIEPMEKRVKVRYRIDGVLHEVMQQPNSIKNALISRIKVMSNMDIAERRIPQDGRISKSYEGKVVDVRVASLPTPYGEKITMRLMERSAKIITLQELGFPIKQFEGYQKVVKYPYGFILITGPTGSGKSTTLYATLQQLNSVDKNIITLEDPIERRMDGLNQIQINDRAGLTFAKGLRSILRSDPDIIMVGEIRDHETAKIAVESALTGHLVLSTLHTNDSSSAITRLSEMGVETYLTASALAGVIAQRLARRLCKECKEKFTISREDLLKQIPDFPLDQWQAELTLYRPKGCLHCNNTGYRGRVGIYEYLHVSDYLRKLILSDANSNTISEAAVKEGM
ncbi:MAG TPA: type II secretion system protein GspE, partial [Clostridiales bacterium]|nr:type II secretion system protein GspE [Clostridiales bacterium]